MFRFLLILGLFLPALPVKALTRYVTTSGSAGGNGTSLTQPWSLARACSSALPGDLVLIQPGVYSGKFEITASGDATPGGAGPITYRADGARGSVIIDGTGQAGANDGLLFIRATNSKPLARDLIIEGLELQNFLNVNDASGIRILSQGNGAVSRITVRNCSIHHITGSNAMGITIYGRASANAITGITLENCEVFQCQPSPSEAVVFNGNVDGFTVRNCSIHDCNNIGLDMIGGEPGFPAAPAAGKVARNGLVTGCRVSNIINAVGISAAGIYVDGGRLITIEHCLVETSDLGIEIGSENFGIITDGVIVRNNILRNNRLNALVIGGAEVTNGRVNNCLFRHNLCYQNGTADPYATEIFLQWGSGNVFENNLIHPIADLLPSFLYIIDGNTIQTFRNNLWYTPGGTSATDGDFAWYPDSGCCGSYAEFRSVTGQDGNGLYANPSFINAPAGDYHLAASSPARHAGTASTETGAAALTDMDGLPRLQGSAPDIGPDEIWPIDSWWRAAFPTTALTAAGLSADPDADGSTNLLEYTAGSLPLSAASRPVFAPLAWPAIGYSFQRSTTATDTELRLFTTSNPADWTLSNVTPAAGPVTSNRQTLQWTLPGPLSGRLLLRAETRLKP